MPYDKPFAPAADRNRHAIWPVLCNELRAGDRVLEIGSGTGQHLCHFAAAEPRVHWQPSELGPALDGVRAWVKAAACANLAKPFELDVMMPEWPRYQASVCYTANTLHIMSAAQVEAFFAGCHQVLVPDGRICIYGPFLFDGQPVCESNLQFDTMLRARDSHSGLRRISWLNVLAEQQGLQAARITALPANNHLLVFNAGMAPSGKATSEAEYTLSGGVSSDSANARDLAP